jgi:hypothetical protein
MTKPIEIPLVANARGVVVGAKDAENAFGKVADSLDDMARDGDRAGDKLERSFEDIQREARQTGNVVQRESKEGFGKASEASREFKSEAIQNLSETASSFDGSLTSISDGIQGTFGGLAASLPGPLGIAAAGIAVVGGAVLAGAAAQAEATKQIVENAFQDMVDSGQNYVSQEFYNQSIQDLLDDSGKLDQARYASKELGLGLDTIVAAMAGVPGPAKEVTDAINRYNDAGREAVEGTRGAWAPHFKEVTGAIDGATGAVDSATSKLGIYQGATKAAADAVDAQTAKVKALGDAVVQLPDGRTVKVNAVLDDAQLKAALNSIQSKPLKVPVTFTDKYGRAIY